MIIILRISVKLFFLCELCVEKFSELCVEKMIPKIQQITIAIDK